MSAHTKDTDTYNITPYITDPAKVQELQERNAGMIMDKSYDAIVSVDTETRGTRDLSKSGADVYVEHGHRLLITSYAINDEPVKRINNGLGEPFSKEFIELLYDPNVLFSAWNAAFERAVFGHYFGMRLNPEKFIDPMSWAASLSLPLSLAGAANALGTEEKKDKEGERLIKLFSVQQKKRKTGELYWVEPQDNPEDFERFGQYCDQDVETERAIRHRLESYPMPSSEWIAYWTTERINQRGILIDTELCEAAVDIDSVIKEKLTNEAIELTGLDNPNSTAQLKKWLINNNFEIGSLNKKNVDEEIRKLRDTENRSMDEEKILKVLEYRQKSSLTSTKKYTAALNCVNDDHRARQLFVFNGATATGRYASRRIQLQNLYRNTINTLDSARYFVTQKDIEMLELLYGDVTNILAECCRTMLIPGEGRVFGVSDFNAIEARVLGWLAGESDVLEAFRNGEDLYCSTATMMTGKPCGKHGPNPELRQLGKIATLACGYQGGVGAIENFKPTDMELSIEEEQEIVDSWRSSHPNTVSFWWDLQRAAINTTKDHQERTVRKVTLQYYGNTLWIVLPSGRKLAYIAPKITKNRFGSDSLSFMGSSGVGGKWHRCETYGGKLCENVTQAVSRDILVEAMIRLERAGIEIVGHVHDECICSFEEGRFTIDEISTLMAITPEWCKDLPLKAAGYMAPNFYFKD